MAKTTSALLALSPLLAAVIAPIEAGWKAWWVDRYVKRAESEFPAWVEAIEKCEQPDPKQPWKAPINEIKRPAFLKWMGDRNRESEPYQPSRERYLELIAAGKWVADVERAVKYGTEQYEANRAVYLGKLTTKVFEIVDRTLPQEVTGNLSVRGGVLEGTVHVVIDAANDFTVDASVKMNYRYGENAANRDITQYQQYPFLIRWATIKGAKVESPSVESVAAAFGGWTFARVAAQKKIDQEAKGALKKAIHAADEKKHNLGNLRDAYNTLEYARESVAAGQCSNPNYVPDSEKRVAACLTKCGIADPGSKKATNKLIKLAKAEVDAAKEALKQFMEDAKAE